MKLIQLAMLGCIVLTASGCATITSEEYQRITLKTSSDDGQPVDKAECTLKNDKGEWKSESPGFVQVHRSAEDLVVECSKEGNEAGFLRAISRAAGGMWGNIVFGGGIGAIIDHSNGTGYNYPNDLPVVMGKSSIVDRKDELEREQQQDPEQDKPAEKAATSPAPAEVAAKE